MALPREYRLRYSSLIALVYKKGVFYKTPFFRMHYKKNTTSAQIAIIISKKVDARAVVRNRIKRKFSAALQEIHKDWNDLPYYITFSVFDNSKEVSFQNIKKMLQQAFLRIR